jgi:hypothetical protein
VAVWLPPQQWSGVCCCSYEWAAPCWCAACACGLVSNAPVPCWSTHATALGLLCVVLTCAHNAQAAVGGASPGDDVAEALSRLLQGCMLLSCWEHLAQLLCCRQLPAFKACRDLDRGWSFVSRHGHDACWLQHDAVAGSQTDVELKRQLTWQRCNDGCRTYGCDVKAGVAPALRMRRQVPQAAPELQTPFCAPAPCCAGSCFRRSRTLRFCRSPHHDCNTYTNGTAAVHWRGGQLAAQVRASRDADCRTRLARALLRVEIMLSMMID